MQKQSQYNKTNQIQLSRKFLN